MHPSSCTTTNKRHMKCVQVLYNLVGSTLSLQVLKLMAEITVKGGKRTLHYESQMSLGWLYPFEQQRTAIEGLNRLKAVGKEVKSRHALCMVPFACGAMLIDAAGTVAGRCKNVMNW